MTIYVVDTGPFINLFRHYYPGRFPSLWEQFDSMIESGKLTSTREVRNEIEGYGDQLSEWCRRMPEVFPVPTAEELGFVRDIFAVEHYQAMIRARERLSGSPVADPFVIARARSIADGCVREGDSLRDQDAVIFGRHSRQ